MNMSHLDGRPSSPGLPDKRSIRSPTRRGAVSRSASRPPGARRRAVRSGSWGHRDARGLAPDAEPAGGSRLEAELGYGFSVLNGRGVATPWAGLSRSQTAETLKLGQRLTLGRASEWRVESAFGGDGRNFSAGYSCRFGAALDVALDATRREAANDNAPAHAIELRLRVRW